MSQTTSGQSFQPAPHPCATKPLPAQPSPNEWMALTEQATQHPLAHPLYFALARVGFEYAPPRHLIELYQAVYGAVTHQSNAPKNLIRLYPREHGKSEATSHVIPSWLALKNNNIRILLLSETEKQAKAKLRECRETIRTHSDDFGADIAESNKTELTLERSATYDVPTIQAAGFNTGITGGHFDLLLYDDILSYPNQRTQSRRTKIKNQFEDYLNLGSEGQSTFLVIGTRKNPDDLYSELLANPAWDSVVGRAIGDWSIVDQRQFDVRTNVGSVYDGAHIAEIPADETIVGVSPHRDVPVLWPDRWTLEALLMDLLQAQAEGESSRIWKRENQNRAQALHGAVLSANLLNWVEDLPDLYRYEDWNYHAALDVAIEADVEKAARNDTDYWALCIYTDHPRHEQTYIVDMHRNRGMTLQQAIDWVTTKLDPWDTTTVRVEDNAAQSWFVSEAAKQGLNCTGSTSTGSKEDRILSMSSAFESGRIKLVESTCADETWEDFVQEWTAFPEGKHDDLLDSVEIAMRNKGYDSGKNTTRSPFA